MTSKANPLTVSVMQDFGDIENIFFRQRELVERQDDRTAYKELYVENPNADVASVALPLIPKPAADKLPPSKEAQAGFTSHFMTRKTEGFAKQYTSVSKEAPSKDLAAKIDARTRKLLGSCLAVEKSPVLVAVNDCKELLRGVFKDRILSSTKEHLAQVKQEGTLAEQRDIQAEVNKRVNVEFSNAIQQLQDQGVRFHSRTLKYVPYKIDYVQRNFFKADTSADRKDR